MKIKLRQMISILPYLWSFILIGSCKTQNHDIDYLKKVLVNLEQIKSANYSSKLSASAPGDTLQFITVSRYTEEYFNPADTFIGSKFSVTQTMDTSKVSWVYDGLAETFMDWNVKTIKIDSFKTNILPFRLVFPPFYNYTKSIIKYTLETKDSISTDIKDLGDTIIFNLIVHNKTIEFFGKAYEMDSKHTPPPSNYKIWINKSNNLPYRYKRTLTGNTSWQTCNKVEFNKKNIEDFKASEYIPSDFTILTQENQKPFQNDLLDKKAPDWRLLNAYNDTVHINDLRSKVLMIQFTGIGCGPCHEAIPFLKQLVKEYSHNDFECVSIESWSRNIEGIKKYQKSNAMNYKFLISNKQVNNDYQVKGVPAFYILDKNRIIRRIITGYSKGSTDKEIKDAINALI